MLPTKINFMHVVAEMVASVHSFEAEIGDQVSAGDTLLILESMKMEIPVEAPIDGVIKILVEEGEMVEEDTVLARVGQ